MRKFGKNTGLNQIFLVWGLFLSGFCGIAYEVLYFRLLSNMIGDHFAVNAALLITFLFGIALGTKWAYRFLGYLWAIEGSIGLYAIMAVFILPFLDRAIFSLFPGQNMAFSIVLCCLVLALPAFLVGISLPLFASCLKPLIHDKVFSISYTIYNFGAALTVIVTEFYIVRKLGLRNAVFTVALINFYIAAILFSRRKKLANDIKEQPPIKYPLKVIAALVMVSTASAVFQLLALKLSSFIFGPYRESFAMVLGITLLGIALGAAVNQFFKTRFLPFIMINLVLLSALFILFLPILKLYATNFSAFNFESAFIWKLSVLFLIMGGSSLCFGAAIPALMTRESNVAKESGQLLYIASLANVAGYILMVFVIHPLFEYGQILLIICLFLSAAAIIYTWPNKLVIAACFILLVGGMIFQRTVWDENILYLDYTSFTSPAGLRSAMADYQRAKRFRKFNETFAINTVEDRDYFFINGFTSNELGNSAEHIVGVLSSLPVEKTDSALVLGLGSGATAGTVAEIFDNVEVVEISPTIIAKQSLMKQYSFDIASKDNVKIICDDGIRYVKSTPKKYDLILNTVTSPLYFSSSKLYTCDFFRSVSRKLAKNGIYTTWLDLQTGDLGSQIIINSLKKEFEYCWIAMLRGQYFLLVCSHEPIFLKQENRIFNNAKLAEYFLKILTRPFDTCRYAFVSFNGYQCLDRDVPLNTDDKPELEFVIAARGETSLKSLISCVGSNYDIKNVKKEISPDNLSPEKLAMYFLQSNFDSDVTGLVIKKIIADYPRIEGKIPAYILNFYRENARRFPFSNNKSELADWLEHYQEYEEAERVLRQLLAENPDLYKIRYRIGRVLYEQKKYLPAGVMFMAELKVNPVSTDAMYWIGKSISEQQLYEQAIIWFEKCLALNPYYDDANYYAGLAALAAGSADKAAVFLARERIIDPWDIKAVKQLRSLKKRSF